MKRFVSWLWSFFAVIGIAAVSLAAYNYSINANGFLAWSGRTKLYAPADDKLKVVNNAGTVGTVLDHTANGQFTVYAIDGTTKATGTWEHTEATSTGFLSTVTCSALPVTSTTHHIFLVSDAGAGDDIGLCVETTSGWKLATGLDTDCCS